MTQASAETQTQTTGSEEQASTQQASPGAEAQRAASQAETPARPDWLPEQFWDGEGNAIKGADLKAHLDELAAFKAGEDSRRAAAPEKPEGYELKVPEGLDLGEGVTFQIDESDPMAAFGRSVAHDLGLDQGGFEKLVGSYAQMRVAEAKAIEAAFAQQAEQLGPKAADRQKAIETWMNAKLGPDAAAALAATQFTRTKVGVETMEKVMRLVSSGGGPGFTQSGREGGKLNETVQDRWFPSMRSN